MEAGIAISICGMDWAGNMRVWRLVRGLLPAMAAIALGGCWVTPSSGPDRHDVKSQASATIPYALVKLTPDTVSTVSRFEPRGLAGVFPDKYVPPAKIKFG